MQTRLTRAELRLAILGDPVCARVLTHVQSASDGDAAHDVEHLLRVARWTLALYETPDGFREAVCAALLHDLVNVPKNHPDRARASALSADAARALLTEDLSSAALTLVCEAIEDHSYSSRRTPRSALGRALQDADRLEALGALGIARTFSTGVRLGALYFDAEDPWAERRARDDRAFSVDHFFTKLLSLTSTMQTAAGRAEAERRTRILRQFLEALADEIGAPLPPDLG